jgi:hypothetical protein
VVAWGFTGWSHAASMQASAGEAGRGAECSVSEGEDESMRRSSSSSLLTRS